MKTRKAISPILSIIILIGISVIGGSMLYSVQTQALTTGLNNIKLSITDLKMEKDFTGACYFQSTAYNSGTESVQSIKLKTTLDSGEDFDFKGGFDFGSFLVPGNSTEKNWFNNTGEFCGNFTVSNTYSVMINVTSINSEFSIIKPMKVENMTVT